MRGGFTLIKFGKVALNSINFNFAGDLSGAKSNVAALDMGGGSTQITFVPSQMVIIDTLKISSNILLKQLVSSYVVVHITRKF